MTRILTIPLALVFLASCAAPSDLVISVIGTADIHGALLESPDGSGMPAISGYVETVRKDRHSDGGAVLLIDAGDMWQGTLESNLSEGASMVQAYNALGYTAAAVGNHEFDFGPVGPRPIPHSPDDDPRGVLKKRAGEASFPFLAANLIDDSTGDPVNWPNVRPSLLTEVAGVKVGIIGVMTKYGLAVSIAANTKGLSLSPLAETIEAEAIRLRDAGATIVIVTAHAGGGCREFDDAYDISSCKPDAEIFELARDLPTGLVDHIVAGHTHEAVAHVVNGISISQAYSRARALSRVDLIVDRGTGQLADRRIFPPIPASAATGYDPALAAIAGQAADSARQIKSQPIGVFLETPFELTDSPESPLGNLYTDGLLAASNADIAIHRTNTSIRANLPAGDLTYGSMYEMSPFDNQLTVIEMPGEDLRTVMTEQADDGRFRVGFSGMRVYVKCSSNDLAVSMVLDNGREITDSDTLQVAVVNYLALGGDGVLISVMPEGGYSVPADAPLARDEIIDWLPQLGASLSEADFSSDKAPKWNLGEQCP